VVVGLDTKGISKLDGTSAMSSVGIPHLESCTLAMRTMDNEDNFHTWKMHMQNSSNKYFGEHSIQLLVVIGP
jgi:hypothetical protein